MEYRTRADYASLEAKFRLWRERLPDPAARRHRLLQYTLRQDWFPQAGTSVLIPAADRQPLPLPPVRLLEASMHILLGGAEVLSGGIAGSETGPALSGKSFTFEDLNALAGIWNNPHGLRRQPATHLLVSGAAEEYGCLPQFLQNTLEWFASESVACLHPLEQYTLMLLRLVDLRPFHAWNFPLSQLIASRWLFVAGYPPPVPAAISETLWLQGLRKGMQGDTSDLLACVRQGVEQAAGGLFVFFGL